MKITTPVWTPDQYGNTKGHYTNQNDMYMNFIKKYFKIQSCNAEIMELGPGNGSFASMLVDHLDGVQCYSLIELKANILDSILTLRNQYQVIYPILAEEVEKVLPYHNFKYDLFVSNVCVAELPREYLEFVLPILINQSDNTMIITQMEETNYKPEWNGEYTKFIKELFENKYKKVIIEPTDYLNCKCVMGFSE